MLIEDGNGYSEVAAAFLLLEESKASITCVENISKESNPEWKSLRVIMADKDRAVLAASFPSAAILIRLYHTLRSFRREKTIEKMGIISGQRSTCLEMVQQMAYAQSEKSTWICIGSFKIVLLRLC